MTVTFFEHVRQESLDCVVVRFDVDVVGPVRTEHNKASAGTQIGVLAATEETVLPAYRSMSR